MDINRKFQNNCSINISSMLKGDRLAACVKENNKRSVQASHINKCPSSILTRLDPNFTINIDTKTPNPAKAYEHEMKALLMEDIKNGMKERSKSIKQKNQEKNYKERLDGVLCQLEKNNATYSMVLQGRMNRQQERKRLFIDQDKLKNSRINQFIDKQYDKDVFNHGNDLYQEYQRQEQKNSLFTLERQKEEKAMAKMRIDREKEEAYQNRLLFQQQMKYQNIMDKQDRIQRQQEYNTQLSTLVHSKIARESLDRMVEEKAPVKHNPITNPIEYHIENPYLLQRMQHKSRHD